LIVGGGIGLFSAKAKFGSDNKEWSGLGWLDKSFVCKMDGLTIGQETPKPEDCEEFARKFDNSIDDIQRKINNNGEPIGITLARYDTLPSYRCVLDELAAHQRRIAAEQIGFIEIVDPLTEVDTYSSTY
jgi:hypothetical protein